MKISPWRSRFVDRWLPRRFCGGEAGRDRGAGDGRGDRPATGWRADSCGRRRRVPSEQRQRRRRSRQPGRPPARRLLRQARPQRVPLPATLQARPYRRWGHRPTAHHVRKKKFRFSIEWPDIIQLVELKPNPTFRSSCRCKAKCNK